MHRCIAIQRSDSRLFRVTILLALAAVLSILSVTGPATAGEPHTDEDTLFQVRVRADNPTDLADRLEARGYVVLRGTIGGNTLDVVASPGEVAQLEQLGLNLIHVVPGRPLREIVDVQDGTDAVPAGYSDLASITEAMFATAEAYPDIAAVWDLTQVYDLPATFEGRHIYAMKISDNVAHEEDEPALLLVGNHHADEVVGTVIALHAIAQFTAEYGRDPDITAAVDNHEIWIAPTWNPDGLEYVFNVNSLWRKNRRVFSGGKGVDLNRNYPQGWRASCSGSTSPGSNTYKGPGAASEAETRTMLAWSLDQRFAKVVDYHSSGREAVYGYNCLQHPFSAWMAGEARTLAAASGYGRSARKPSAEGEHYQWQFAQMGAWAFLIETALSHQPSYSAAVSEAQRVWPGILHAVNRPVTLSGHVRDAETGAPLEARIELVNVTFRNDETNSSEPLYGRYHVFLPTGTYQARFSCPGYLSETISLNVNSDATAEIRDVALWPDSAPERFALDVQAQGQGSVALDPAGGIYEAGTQVTLTARADAGWIFQGWQGDVTSTDNPLQVIMDADRQITAVFIEGQGTGQLAFDGFESNDLSGGQGWLGTWTRQGNLVLVKNNPYEGRRYVKLTGGLRPGRLERAVDLSGAAGAVLRFAGRIKSFENKDKAYVKVNINGGDYTVVAEFLPEHSDNQWHLYEIDLSAYNLTADFRIVFEAAMGHKSKDMWFLDNIEIIGR